MKSLYRIAIACYVACLFLPSIVYTTFYSSYSPTTDTDYGSTILGGYGLFGICIGMFAWYANILFFISLLFVKRKQFKKAFILSVSAFLLGLQAFMLNKWSGFEGGQYQLQYLGIGYYVWLASFVLLAIYAFLSFRQSNSGSNIVH